jgi:hypothetical protein
MMPLTETAAAIITASRDENQPAHRIDLHPKFGCRLVAEAQQVQVARMRHQHREPRGPAR